MSLIGYNSPYRPCPWHVRFIPQLKTFLCTGLHRKPLRGDAARVSWEAGHEDTSGGPCVSRSPDEVDTPSRESEMAIRRGLLGRSRDSSAATWQGMSGSRRHQTLGGVPKITPQQHLGCFRSGDEHRLTIANVVVNSTFEANRLLLAGSEPSQQRPRAATPCPSRSCGSHFGFFFSVLVKSLSACIRASI